MSIIRQFPFSFQQNNISKSEQPTATGEKLEKANQSCYSSSHHNGHTRNGDVARSSAMKTILGIVLIWSGLPLLLTAEDRVFADVKINSNPVKLFLDTGAGVEYMLFSTSAQKLGLKVTPPLPNDHMGPGRTPVGMTELCKLDILGMERMTQFAVVDKPAYIQAGSDGVIGWPAVMNNVFSMDFVNHTFAAYPNLPEDADSWTKLKLLTNSEDLTLELRATDDEKLILSVDTGSEYGIELNSGDWVEWKSAHANQPLTIEAYYTPSSGFVVSEQSWADKISLGSLTLTGVSVMPSDSSAVAAHTSAHIKYKATLGFEALRRLDIIIDGKHGFAYLRPKTTPPLPWPHNRLGAVFVPQDLQSDDLVAHVAVGSPAYEAGIRNNDLLLRIGELDTTKWRTDPAVLPLSRFWSSSPGTKHELSLRRDGKIYRTTVILRNIIPPDGKGGPQKLDH